LKEEKLKQFKNYEEISFDFRKETSRERLDTFKMLSIQLTHHQMLQEAIELLFPFERQFFKAVAISNEFLRFHGSFDWFSSFLIELSTSNFQFP
jgi:hypothetical protein